MINQFISTLHAKRDLDDAEEEVISHNLDRIFDLQKFPFTALEIVRSLRSKWPISSSGSIAKA
jgi:hypothetical protein